MSSVNPATGWMRFGGIRGDAGTLCPGVGGWVFRGVSAVVLCAVLVGCQSRGAASATPASADMDEHCPKVLEESRATGIDYVPTLRRAAKGDDVALSQLFQLTGSDHLDADAQQCHIEALAELLRRLGDLQFATALANESADTRRAVVNGLVIELESPTGVEQSREAFAAQYPRTAETLPQ